MSKTKRNSQSRVRQVGCGKNRKTKVKRGGCTTCSKTQRGGNCHCSKCSKKQSGGNIVGIGANFTSWVPHFFTHTVPNAFMGIPSQPPFW